MPTINLDIEPSNIHVLTDSEEILLISERNNIRSFFDNMVSFPFHHWLINEDYDYMLKSTI